MSVADPSVLVSYVESEKNKNEMQNGSQAEQCKM